MSQSSVVCSLPDTVVRIDDLPLLQERQWLNDTLIDFTLEYKHLERRLAAGQCRWLSCSVVKLVRDLTDPAHILDALPKDFFTEDDALLLLPVNDHTGTDSGGTHWSLLARLGTRQWLHFDSMYPLNLQPATDLFRVLPVARGPGGLTSASVPQQSNGYDCGVWVCMVAVWLMEGCAASVKHRRWADVKREVCESMDWALGFDPKVARQTIREWIDDAAKKRNIDNKKS
jgi:hypothetical protein